MSSSSKKRKNKWKSIAVEEILPNAIVRPTTSWAEEVESELNEYTIKKISSISLPTAPRATCDVFIDENKINPNGPFTAYLSNLPYDITEDDIAHHFKEYKVEDIQLPKDSRHDRMRGFGYVQFKDKSSLLQALHEGEVTLKGRLVRISLPNDEEQNKDKGSRGGVSFSRRDVSDRIDGVERNLGEWRAAAPIPHDPDKGFTGPNRREGGPGGPFREPKAFDEPRPFTRGGFRDKDRDFDNRSNDRGGNRMFGKGYDRDDRGSRMGFGGKGYEDREMRRDLDRDMRRDSNREMRREPDREMRRESDREMRREPDREMRRDFDREPVAKEEPKSRPKLEIQPRTKPLEPNVPEALPSSIFGGAKPVDTLKREMEIEAKLSSKAASQPVTRSRTSTPPPRSLTPHSYHSRSSSTSSTSSFRYRNAESVERRQEQRQSDDESKDISSNKTHDDNVASETSKEPEFKEPEPPKNVWEQRKAASAAAVAETPVSDAPTSVIEKSNVYENPVDVNVVENRSRNEDASKESGSVAGDDGERRASVDRKNSTDRYVPRQRSTVDKNSNSDDDFVRYEPDHFSNPDAPQYQQQSSNRGGGPRYSDNSKFNFNRNNNGNRNRENRRDNRRSDTRRPDNGQFRRDDNYVSRNSENSAFGSKWNSASRNRNGGPGPRRYGDRDNGYSQRDRYDNGSSFSKPSSCSSSTTNLRDDDRFDKKADERLNVEEPREDTETGAERVNIIVNDDNANKKTVENGNENGVDTDDTTRKSAENIAIDEQSENDNAFSSSKSRKRDKKKKNQVKDGDQLNEKDGDRPNDRQKNQKDEKKKNVDNQVNEKVNNKNNAKNKEKATKKKSELRRDGEDIAQMPKAKEEKAPNFQDSNRFKFLADE